MVSIISKISILCKRMEAFVVHTISEKLTYYKFKKKWPLTSFFTSLQIKQPILDRFQIISDNCKTLHFIVVNNMENNRDDGACKLQAPFKSLVKLQSVSYSDKDLRIKFIQ